MILKISNPRDAIIQSYQGPIAYKDYILLDGVVIIKFCKLYKTKHYEKLTIYTCIANICRFFFVN